MLSQLKAIVRRRRMNKLMQHWHSNARIGSEFEIVDNADLFNEAGNPEAVQVGNKVRFSKPIVVCKTGAKFSIGDYSVLQNGVQIRCANHIQIGDFVGVAENVMLIDNNTHPIGIESWIRHRVRVAPGGPGYPGNGNGWEESESAPIIIKDGVWIGSGARVLKGVTVGEGAIIASNSVVTKNVDAYSVVAGNPAKKVKQLEPASKPFSELLAEAKQEFDLD